MGMAKAFCGTGKKRGGYTGTAHYIAAHGTYRYPKEKKMLTESEREWLEERVLLPCYSCKYCTGYHNQSCNAFEPLSSCWNRLCENFDFEYFDEEVFLDAAEFEGRVVAKLAGILDRTLRSRDYTLHADCTRVCPAATDCTKNNLLGFDCAPYLLKWARLAVEEEMEKCIK